MPGFRLEEAVRTRIEALQQLCGEDPSSAFAARFGALPILRDLGGWTAIRPDGSFFFADDTTGRVRTELPSDWRERAMVALRERYPEIWELVGESGRQEAEC